MDPLTEQQVVAERTAELRQRVQGFLDSVHRS